jgi:predicted DNA repair protein MutK
MSGLLALLDDVAAIAKVAAASVDDVAAAAAKAGAKAAGVVIDDAAVTPKYVHGFDAHRELPIIWRIARGSLRNKILVLLPALMLLSALVPQAITPLLMLGGAYLCFEGAEKLYHLLVPHPGHAVAADFDTRDPVHLEEERVAGAIKTDFILSAEIMTIALAALPADTLWMQAATLAVVGAAITAAVYGAVALIVKMDDIGLHMAARARSGVLRAAGRGLVVAMPRLLALLSAVGTAAMLWVGGAIVIHGLEDLGSAEPGHTIHDLAAAAGQALPAVAAAAEWLATALLDGLAGLVLGLALIPVATGVVGPALARLTRRDGTGH